MSKRRGNDRNPPQYFGWKPGKPKHEHNVEGISEYALNKARRLISGQFETAGLFTHAKQYNMEFVTNPMIAFARYIDRME